MYAEGARFLQLACQAERLAPLLPASYANDHMKRMSEVIQLFPIYGHRFSDHFHCTNRSYILYIIWIRADDAYFVGEICTL